MNKLLILCTALLLTACMNTPPLPSETKDGLQLVESSSFKELYIRQGTDFSQYSAITIETMPLSYSDERRTHKLPSLNDKDFQLTDKEMGYFQERASKGFSLGYDKPQQATAGLIVRSVISDFYLTSPISNSVIQPSKSFVSDSSRMKITTEFIDANSQQVLLRVTDTLKTGDLSSHANNLSRMNSVTYWQDVYREFRRWGSRIKTSIQ